MAGCSGEASEVSEPRFETNKSGVDGGKVSNHDDAGLIELDDCFAECLAKWLTGTTLAECVKTG